MTTHTREYLSLHFAHVQAAIRRYEAAAPGSAEATAALRDLAWQACVLAEVAAEERARVLGLDRKPQKRSEPL